MKKRSRFLLGFCALIVAMISMSLVTFAEEPSQKPGKVTGVRQTKSGKDCFDIEWDIQSVMDCRYKVEVSIDGVNWKEEKDAYSNKAYIYDLNEATNYKVRVRAYTTYNNSETYKREYVYADEYSDVITVATLPKVVTGVKQTSATTSSITLTWNKSANATGYCIYNGYGDKAELIANVKTNSATIKNIRESVNYDLVVYPYTVAGTYTAENKNYSDGNYLYNSKIRLLPKKINASKINAKYYYPSIKKISIEWPEASRVDGYQVQAYTYNGKRATYRVNADYNYATLEKIGTRRFYKVRVRGYSKINGSTKYGAWSSYKYMAHQPKVTAINQVGSKKQANVRWESVKGATSYTVYMSTKQTSGYKKVGTTKKTSIKISKLGKSSLKKNKKYYVYVVANRKVGKTTYKANAEYCWQFRLIK